MRYLASIALVLALSLPRTAPAPESPSDSLLWSDYPLQVAPSGAPESDPTPTLPSEWEALEESA